MLAWVQKVLSYIPTIFTWLTSLGINTGPVGQEIVKIANLTSTDIANYDAGQAVVVGTIPQTWVPGATADGVIVLVQDGGPAYKSLFG